MEIESKLSRTTDLTVEELRRFKGLEKISEIEAIEILKTVKELSLLACLAAERMHKNRI